MALTVSVQADLAARMRGPVLVDGDPSYDELRTGWNAMFDRRPAAIARCTGVADVQAALTFARERDLVVAVRCGGHSMPGACTTEGGLLIELGLMQGVRVDPVKRTANVQGGATWGQFDREAQVYGLATQGGVVSTTGVGGLTLGGGVGRLMRQVGLSCDNVLSYEVVLADGRVVTASPESEPDLYWALRGGGGNFGIVTNFEFRLHPIGPTILGGLAMWPLVQAREVIEASAQLLDDSPEELSVHIVYTSAPEFPLIDESLWGTPVLAVAVSWTGDMREGEDLLASVRATGTPLVDTIGPIEYTKLQSLMDAQAPFGRRGYIRSGFLAELGDEIQTIVEQATTRRTSPLSLIEFYLMGGAVARVNPDETAFAQRSPKLYYSAVSQWLDPALDEQEIEWCREVDRALQPFRLPGRYINFVAGDEGSLQEALGESTVERLRRVKRVYDPDGCFAHNPNIRL